MKHNPGVKPMTRFRLVVKSSLTFVFGTALLLTLLQTRPSVAADQSVLFVGNSYTFGNQPNSLQDIAGRLMEEGVLAWKTVFTRQISHGGYRWEQHRMRKAKARIRNCTTFSSKVSSRITNGTLLFCRNRARSPVFPAAKVSGNAAFKRCRRWTNSSPLVAHTPYC